MTLTAASWRRLDGVHPDLVSVIEKASAATTVPFQVSEGLRTPDRQRALVAAGKSQTLHSYHLAQPDGTAWAVDLVVVEDGVALWDWPSYKLLSVVVKNAATELGIPIVWGGDWTTLRDGPHYQLDRERIPA